MVTRDINRQFSQFFQTRLPTYFKIEGSVGAYLGKCRDTLVGYCSRYSDWLRAGRPRGRSSSPGRVKNFLFSTSSRSAVGPTQPPIQWAPGGKAAGA
jgi:hypothetical protein